MIISALIGVLGGLLVGGRFRVFALVPALIGGVAVAVGLTFAGALTMGAAALGFLCFAVSLQAGYGAMLIVGGSAKRSIEPQPLTT